MTESKPEPQPEPPTPAPKPDQQPEPEPPTARYRDFRDYLEHEDSLINYRLTWSILIQGFLFAAFGFSVQKMADLENSAREGVYHRQSGTTEQSSESTTIEDSPASPSKDQQSKRPASKISKLEKQTTTQKLTTSSLTGNSVDPKLFETTLPEIPHYKALQELTHRWIPVLGILISICAALGIWAANHAIRLLTLNCGEVTGYPELAGAGSKRSKFFGRISSLVPPITIASTWVWVLFWFSDYQTRAPWIALLSYAILMLIGLFVQ